MTTVERHPTLETLSDATSNAPRTNSALTTRTRSKIPPAVPSPPSIRAHHSTASKSQASATLKSSSKMASDYSSQWLFTDAEVANTLSIRDGITTSEERSRRAKGVNFITQVGILLKLPQLTLATASVFFHRFYMRYSMVPEKHGLHHYNIAATAIFLATKTEENCRKTKEIVISVAKVAQKNASLIIDEQSKEYWRWRDNILLYEELMLEILTFDLALKSPYNYLYDFIRELQIEDNKPLRNAAWAFLNDSCITIMCLVLTAKDTAIASLYFAARYTGETIPEDEDGPSWWEHLGADPAKIGKAIGIMSEFYRENPLRRNENPLEQSPAAFGNEVDLDRTRGSVRSHARTQSPDDATRSQHHSPNGNVKQEADAATTPADADGGEVGEKFIASNPPPAPSPPRQDANATFNTSEDNIVGDPNSSSNLELDSIPNPVLGMDPDISGSSDAALKAAANDPVTHGANGQISLTPSAAPSASSDSINEKPAANATIDTLPALNPKTDPMPPINAKEERSDDYPPPSQESVDLVQCHSESPPVMRKGSPKRKAEILEGQDVGEPVAKKPRMEKDEESEEGELEE